MCQESGLTQNNSFFLNKKYRYELNTDITKALHVSTLQIYQLKRKCKLFSQSGCVSHLSVLGFKMGHPSWSTAKDNPRGRSYEAADKKKVGETVRLVNLEIRC